MTMKCDNFNFQIKSQFEVITILHSNFNSDTREGEQKIKEKKKIRYIYIYKRMDKIYGRWYIDEWAHV